MPEDSDGTPRAAATRRAVAGEGERRSFVPIVIVGVAILSAILVFASEDERPTSKPSASQVNPPPPAAPNN